MNAYLAPFPDELLTSWFARRGHRIGERGPPAPKAFRDRKGGWRHPDIRPARAWLSAAGDRFGVAPSQLERNTFARRFPSLPLDFLAWVWPPFDTRHEGLRPSPRLRIAWCNRCLAEDFAAGRPAHVRHQWVMAALGFCHRHHWPLAERCGTCGSPLWKFAAPRRGPLRMVCKDCWRPLERAFRCDLAASADMTRRWECVIACEAEIVTALAGRTPNQFRFNFTSASQLLDEIRDICSLLARGDPDDERSNIPLNAFACPAINPGRLRLEFPPSWSDFPLAVASVARRRCLIAATCAILDASGDAGRLLFGEGAPPAIEAFLAMAGRTGLDRSPASAARWSPVLSRRIRMALSSTKRQARILKLERSISALRSAFA